MISALSGVFLSVYMYVYMGAEFERARSKSKVPSRTFYLSFSQVHWAGFLNPIFPKISKL